MKVAGKDLIRLGTGGRADRPIVVIRIDATLIQADSPKAGCAGNYQGGYGFHPIGAWCTNIGDSLAIMLRPGNAGAFTASDHLLIFHAATAQIPAPWRGDLLITIDGAGASHEVIDYLTAMNTSLTHGRRGRRVEYSIGWPNDERTPARLIIHARQRILKIPPGWAWANDLTTASTPYTPPEPSPPDPTTPTEPRIIQA